MNDIHNLITRAIVGLTTGQMPGDVSDWLSKGLQRWREKGGLLDAHLTLPEPEHEQPSNILRQLRLDRRDDDIRSITKLMHGAPWKQAGAIAGWCEEYHNKVQPITRVRSLLCEDLGGIDIPLTVLPTLGKAASHGEDLPESQMQVFRILNGTRRDY